MLAFGYWVGFRDLRLMVWAAIVAAVCVFGTLLAARALFFQAERPGRSDAAARVLSYLLPPLFLGVGALDWTLWSGMEVALFLGIWGVALLAFLALDRAPPGTRARRRGAWLLGVVGAFLVLTRPEASDDGRRLRSRVRRSDRFAREGSRGAAAELARIALPRRRRRRRARRSRTARSPASGAPTARS